MMKTKRWPRKAKKWAKRQPGVILIEVRGKRMVYAREFRLPFRLPFPFGRDGGPVGK